MSYPPHVGILSLRFTLTQADTLSLSISPFLFLSTRSCPCLTPVRISNSVAIRKRRKLVASSLDNDRRAMKPQRNNSGAIYHKENARCSTFFFFFSRFAVYRRSDNVCRRYSLRYITYSLITISATNQI